MQDSITMQGSSMKPASLGCGSLSRVGNTPLLRFDSLAPQPDVQILGKAEWANPGGSVKDRAAFNIVETALRSGELGKGKRLLDATSGNTGIAYAMIGAARGIPVTLCVPENVSIERKRILAAYGAEILWTDPLEGTDGAIRKAQALYAAEPKKYFYADQYSNDANWLAHFHGTANEIWSQTEGKITHFVAGLGTSGTFMGTTRRLKELNPAIPAIFSLSRLFPFCRCCTMSGNADVTEDEHVILSRFENRNTFFSASARLVDHRGRHLGTRNRRERRNLQCCSRCAVAAARQS